MEIMKKREAGYTKGRMCVFEVFVFGCFVPQRKEIVCFLHKYYQGHY